MVDPTVHAGLGVPQAVLVRLLRPLSVGHEIPNRRQITRHARMNTRQNFIPQCAGKRIDVQSSFAQVERRAGLNRLVDGGAALCAVREGALGKHLLQRVEKAGVGRIVHRGQLSGRYGRSNVGSGS